MKKNEKMDKIKIKMNDKKEEDKEKIHFKKYIVKGYNKPIPDELEFKQFIIGSNNSNQIDKGIVYKHFTAKNSDNPLSYKNDRYFKTYQVGQILNNDRYHEIVDGEKEELKKLSVENELEVFITKRKSQTMISYNDENFKNKLKAKVEIVAKDIIAKYSLTNIKIKNLAQKSLELYDFAVSQKDFKPNKLGRQKMQIFCLYI